MNNTQDVISIDLKDFWGIFIQRLWLMILAAVICAGSLFAINKFTFVPQYNSTATLYILRQSGENQEDGSTPDFSLALNLVSDCTYLLKSHAVVDQVIKELDLPMGYSELQGRISTSNPSDTRILAVTVTGNSPEQAKEIVDCLCQVGQEKIAEAMGFKQVNFYERGTLETWPCNTTPLSTYALAGIVAAVLVYGIFLVMYFFDDRIRSDEDIQNYLGLSVLGDIPNADGTGKSHYGYYAYGKDDRKGKK